MSSNLEDALNYAAQRADALVHRARAPAGPLPVAAGGVGVPAPRLDLAREQVLHFRGWVFAAIRPIAQRIAGQPIRAARRVKQRRSTPGAKALLARAPDWVKALDVGLEPVEAHPILSALADPSPIHTAGTLKYLTVASLECTGRAYWWIAEEEGRVQFWPLATSWVRPQHDPSPFVSYEVRLPGAAEAFVIPGAEMLHFHYPDPADPVFGALAPLQAIASGIVADEAIAEAQRRAFANGIHPGALVTIGRHPDAQGIPGQRPILTPAQRTQVITAIKQYYRGVVRYDEPMILDGMIENVTRFTATNREMDFLNSAKLTKDRIFLGFGVNAIVAGQIESANRASSLAADDHFTSNCVNPKISLLSECLTAWLAPRFNDPDLLLWIEAARTRDPDQERLDMEQAVKARAVTINEVRSRIGLPSVEWGDVQVPAGGAAPLGEGAASFGARGFRLHEGNGRAG